MVTFCNQIFFWDLMLCIDTWQNSLKKPVVCLFTLVRKALFTRNVCVCLCIWGKELVLWQQMIVFIFKVCICIRCLEWIRTHSLHLHHYLCNVKFWRWLWRWPKRRHYVWTRQKTDLSMSNDRSLGGWEASGAKVPIVTCICRNLRISEAFLRFGIWYQLLSWKKDNSFWLHVFFLFRNRMSLNANQAFYLIINNKSVASMSTTLAEIYKDDKDEDGFLYMTYASQEMFGWFQFNSLSCIYISCYVLFVKKNCIMKVYRFFGMYSY